MVREKREIITTPKRRRRTLKDGAVRLSFNHGLGDALMFRVALSHLKKEVLLNIPYDCRYVDLFEDLPNVKAMEVRANHRNYYEIRFHPEDSDRPCKGGPKTKTRICMEHELGIVTDEPVKPLPLKWATKYTSDAWATMMKVIQGDSRPYIVFHGQASSSPWRKSCPLWMAHKIQEVVEAMGFRLIVLNYDFNYRFDSSPDYWWIGLNDSKSTKGWPLGVVPMWHILNQASGFIGIDSGPLHLALTIPRLPCVFIRKEIDFMTSFYDCGLKQIKEVMHQGTTFEDVELILNSLPGFTRGGREG